MTRTMGNENPCGGRYRDKRDTVAASGEQGGWTLLQVTADSASLAQPLGPHLVGQGATTSSWTRAAIFLNLKSDFAGFPDGAVVKHLSA